MEIVWEGELTGCGVITGTNASSMPYKRNVLTSTKASKVMSTKPEEAPDQQTLQARTNRCQTQQNQ